MGQLTRKTLEVNLINTILIASEHILSCNVINRIIRMTRLKNNTFSAGIAASITSLLVFILTWVINIIGPQLDSLNYNRPLIIPAFLTGVAFFTVKVLHDNLLPPNRERAVGLAAEPDGIIALGDWFKKSFNVTKQIVFSTVIGILAIVTTMTLSYSFPILITNLGFYTSVFIGMFALGNGVYCALTIPTLASTASNHRMNLFPYDPASTTTIRIASAGFGKLALANGLVSTLVISLIFAFRPWQEIITFRFALAWLLFGWGTAFYSFVFPHYYISKIIVREKHIQIEKLETLILQHHDHFNGLSERKIDILQKLIDLREKVLKSRNTSIEFRGWRDFVSSLLLPLASFTVGVIDIPTIIRKILS